MATTLGEAELPAHHELVTRAQYDALVHEVADLRRELTQLIEPHS